MENFFTLAGAFLSAGVVVELIKQFLFKRNVNIELKKTKEEILFTRKLELGERSIQSARGIIQSCGEIIRINKAFEDSYRSSGKFDSEHATTYFHSNKANWNQSSELAREFTGRFETYVIKGTTLPEFKMNDLWFNTNNKLAEFRNKMKGKEWSQSDIEEQFRLNRDLNTCLEHNIELQKEIVRMVKASIHQ